MPEVQLIGLHVTVAGKERPVLKALGLLASASRAEPGNLSFEAYRQLDDPRTYLLLERYTSPEARRAHRDSEHHRWLMTSGIVSHLVIHTVEAFECTSSTTPSEDDSFLGLTAQKNPE